MLDAQRGMQESKFGECASWRLVLRHDRTVVVASIFNVYVKGVNSAAAVWNVIHDICQILTRRCHSEPRQSCSTAQTCHRRTRIRFQSQSVNHSNMTLLKYMWDSALPLRNNQVFHLMWSKCNDDLELLIKRNMCRQYLWQVSYYYKSLQVTSSCPACLIIVSRMPSLDYLYLSHQTTIINVQPHQKLITTSKVRWEYFGSHRLS